MKKLFPILFLLFTSCFLFEEEDKNQNTNLTLSLKATGVTTVRLNVEPEDSLAQFTFELTRDDSSVNTLSIQSDTLLKDTGLNPNTTYTYKGYWKDGSEPFGESNTLNVTTMDTTSYNFTWEFDSLGEYGSYLNDVWIVDENDIWVVGKIVTDSTNYNVGHWNGSEWNFILAENHDPISSIKYFSDDDIWALGSYPIHWDGIDWTMYHLTNMGVIPGGLGGKIWSKDRNFIYFFGRYGRVIQYNGTDFVAMDTGTNFDIRDISGQEEILYATSWSISGIIGSSLLRYDGTEWTTIFTADSYLGNPENGDYGFFWTVDVVNDTAYVKVKSGLLKIHIYNQSVQFVTNEYLVSSIDDYLRIHVQAPNDIIATGGAGGILHFNGLTWGHTLELDSWTIQYKGSDRRNDDLVIVGMELWEYGLVVRGRIQ